MSPGPNIDPKIVAAHYATREKHDRRKELRKVLQPPFDAHREALSALQLSGEESLLDVGCGDGESLFGLAKTHRGRLVGIDPNPGMFEETNRRQEKAAHRVEFLQGRADALPFPAASFDVLCAFFMLYHLPNLEAALSEFHRVLKPKGRLLVTAMGGITSDPRAKVHLDPSSVVVENVEVKLQRYFTLKKEFIYKGVAEITDCDSLLAAMDSMRDFFVPPPSDVEWEMLLKSRRQWAEEKIRQEGAVQERVVLGYFIFEKNSGASFPQSQDS